MDYDGLVCTTDLSTDSGKVVGNMERPLQQGDRVGLELDLIVGKLTVIDCSEPACLINAFLL